MDLYVNVKGCPVSFRSSYLKFNLFRLQILKGLNEDIKDLKEINFRSLETFREMSLILDEYDKPYNNGMKMFALYFDINGGIPSEECVSVLKSFGRVDPERFDKSNESENLWYRNNFVIWKKMLAFAIEINEDIICS